MKNAAKKRLALTDRPDIEPVTQWSWLIYMGADNDLDENTADDLEQIKTANVKQVQVVVQVDHLDRATRRHKLIDGHDFSDFPRLTSSVSHLTNMDSRNPKVVGSFLDFAEKKAPCEHRVVVLWSHTAGFQDFSFEGADPDTEVPEKPSQQPVKKKRSEDSESVSKFLRHPNMAAALRIAREIPPDKIGPKYEIIGCDSCLMAMAEVAHEIRDSGDILVASQNNISRDGWDYEKVLSRFTGRHTPEEVAKFIVEVGRRRDHTMFAIKLAQMDNVAEKLDGLGGALLPLLKSHPEKIIAARDGVQLLPRLGYIDLRHFATLLKEELGDAIGGAADAVIDAVDAAVLTPRDPRSPFYAHGLTVYVPTVNVDKNYKKLSLVDAAKKWAAFVRAHAEL